MAMLSVAVLSQSKQAEKPAVPVKVAAVELNTASSEAEVFGDDHPTHGG